LRVRTWHFEFRIHREVPAPHPGAGRQEGEAAATIKPSPRLSELQSSYLALRIPNSEFILDSEFRIPNSALL